MSSLFYLCFFVIFYALFWLENLECCAYVDFAADNFVVSYLEGSCYKEFLCCMVAAVTVGFLYIVVDCLFRPEVAAPPVICWN